jgi:hypothetical protein
VRSIFGCKEKARAGGNSRDRIAAVVGLIEIIRGAGTGGDLTTAGAVLAAGGGSGAAGVRLVLGTTVFRRLSPLGFSNGNGNEGRGVDGAMVASTRAFAFLKRSRKGTVIFN